ncbi:MAG: hypothetical protein CME62_15685 [Halobacteriovoraceae bacterium]|nr:hypothetical protein [Halobacteriovoraceae bacterium]|tara:strand:+ start:6849 stop:7262 length:414 start_codon:yes stop_codon:yes gene_type:complete
MSELKDRVSKEIIAAMKAKDKTRLNVLRYLKKLFIENDTSKKPIAEEDIVIGHAKKIKDSLQLYQDGPQKDEIQAELVVLAEYLPSQLSEDDVKQMIEDIKSSQDNPNMGSIMKELSGQIKGRFDGKKATELVKSSL